jgi:HPt (histidine-containing phosphotransfer) domain-containing protein
LLRELVDVFLSDTPRLLGRVERAIARSDAVGLAETAHALKGSVGNFDSGRVFEAVRQLEMLGRDNNLAHAPGAFAEAKIKIKKLCGSLRRLKL